MKKQKICIIGDGLSGLTTALILKRLNLNIDIYYSKKSSSIQKDTRTTAISNSNLNFLKESLGKTNSKLFWPCKEVELFYEYKNQYSNFLNINNDKFASMHIVENYNLRKILLTKLKVKNVRLINKKIEEIGIKEGFIQINKIKFYYDIVILCLGFESILYDKLNNSIY